MRQLLVLIALLSAACRGSGADPAEVRMANKRIAQLEQIVGTLEADRVRDACQVAELLMRENALQRVELASKMARVKQLEQLLHVVTQSRRVRKAQHLTASDIAGRLVASVQGGSAPAFVIVVDLAARVVVRLGLDAERYGDVLDSPPIREALHGYERDDLWLINGKLYRVALAPVVQRELREGYAGAIIVGHAVDKAFAKGLAERLRLDVGFYTAAATLTQTARVAEVETAIRRDVAKLGTERAQHCLASPVVVRSQNDSYLMLTASLPGDAGAGGAAYAVFARRSLPASTK